MKKLKMALQLIKEGKEEEAQTFIKEHILERGRAIHEDIMSDDFYSEDEPEMEFANDVEAVDGEVFDDELEIDAEEDLMDDEGELDFDSEEASDELESGDDFENLEDKVDDMEDELEQLKAELEALINSDSDMEDDAEMGDMEGSDEESEMEDLEGDEADESTEDDIEDDMEEVDAEERA